MKVLFSKVFHCARPHLWLLISLNATVTGIVSGLSTAATLLFSLCLCSLASFGFILNDIVDREIDAKIHPDRLAFITSANLRFVRVSMWAFLVFGLAIACFLGTNAAIVAISIAISLGAYSLVLRKQLLVATIICAFSITSPLWAPFIVAGTFIPVFHLTIACAAIVLVSARETILDVIDVYGDRIGKRHTIATVMGEQISVIVASILTGTGFLVLLGACFWRILSLPLIETIVIVAGLGGFGWLAISPTMRLAAAKQHHKQLLDSYVSQTRLAMALIPLFFIVDWWSRG